VAYWQRVQSTAEEESRDIKNLELLIKRDGSAISSATFILLKSRFGALDKHKLFLDRCDAETERVPRGS
jgi:hypothetical protein